MNKNDNKHYAEKANNIDGIKTPHSQEDQAATDSISGAVEQAMDSLQEAFTGKKTQLK